MTDPKVSDLSTGAYQTEQIPLQIVELAPLRTLVQEILRRTSLRQEDADIIADALITSELRNLQGQGQGVRRVRAYVERLERGEIDPMAPFQVIKESASLALIDAHNAPGTVVAVKAMRLAVEKAREQGMGCVVVRHSTHFGSASYSASQAVPEGCIGISMTNAGPEMAPWGGYDAVLGTNPWAVAIPTGGPDAMPIILDMALTMAGKGMMGWLMRDGRKMPWNWAITATGEMTDNPAEAMDGTLLPMGEYKGYALSLITDVLTGVLSGGAFGTVPYSNPARQDVAHQFIAYDVGWFQPRDRFFESMAEFIAMVRASRVRPEFDEILLPGEIEWRRLKRKEREGVPLDPVIFAELYQASRSTGVEWPFDKPE